MNLETLEVTRGNKTLWLLWKSLYFPNKKSLQESYIKRYAPIDNPPVIIEYDNPFKKVIGPSFLKISIANLISMLLFSVYYLTFKTSKGLTANVDKILHEVTEAAAIALLSNLVILLIFSNKLFKI